MTACVSRRSKTLSGCDMCKLNFTGYITDSIDIFHISPAMLVNIHKCTVHFNTDIFKTDTGSHCTPANGNNTASAFGSLFLTVELIMNGYIISAVDRSDLCIIDDADLLFLENPRKQANYIGIDTGKYTGHHFDNGNGSAETCKQSCKFDAYDAAADDDEAFRQLGHGKNIIGSYHVFAVYTGNGRTGRGASCCENELIKGNACAVYIKSMRVNNSTETFNKGNAVGLFEPCDSAAELGYDGIFVFCHLCKIKRNLAGDNTAGSGILRALIYLSAVEQSFCGDTAPVKTGPADFTSFNQCNTLAVLSASYCTFITARACAQDNNIIIVITHSMCILSLLLD